MIARTTGSTHMNAQKLIREKCDIREGVRVLRRRCPVLKAMHDRAGEPPLRRYPADFSGLARIIVGQQLSIASAAAIWARLQKALGRVTARSLSQADDATLVAAGLSGAKVRTLRALADAVLKQVPVKAQENGSSSNKTKPASLTIAKLTNATDDEVRDALTAVHGIGPWTADIFIMFCLGRADAWAAGDLALQVGVARAFALGDRVSANETLAIAERWRPWRGVAARLIWADYKNLRDIKPEAAAKSPNVTSKAKHVDSSKKSGRQKTNNATTEVIDE